jgi:hypothetical protein
MLGLGEVERSADIKDPEPYLPVVVPDYLVHMVKEHPELGFGSAAAASVADDGLDGKDNLVIGYGL